VLAAVALLVSPQEVELREPTSSRAPPQQAWFQLGRVEALAGAVAPRVAQVRRPVASV
jgi:hypothetical protein